MALRPAVLVALLALGTGACGGGGNDEDQVEQVVRDFVEATNARDAETLCGELLTDRYIEKATGATGGDTSSCERQLRAVKGLELELVRIERTNVDGDRARVRTVIRLQGERQARLFLLEQEDGDWRLAGGSAG